MPLQYREDTDRLLYITDSGAADGQLMRECCCDTCVDSVACHRYDACCDAATYEELPTYPHYVVISDTKYTALGDPACVLYNGCCYCDHDSTTNKTMNVVDTGITADTSFSNCDSCNAVYEDTCITCNTCNDCDPRLPRSYVITVDATPGGAFSGATAATLKAELVEATATPWTGSCDWRRFFDDTGVGWTVLREKQLRYVSTYWRVFVSSISGGHSSELRQDTGDTGANDTCDPTTLPYDVLTGGGTLISAGTAVIS